jgi:lysophospholipase L1-like esterase
MVVSTEQRPGRPGPSTRKDGRLRAFAREARSWPTILLVLICLFAGIPLTIALVPDQELEILGQHISVGARAPDGSVSGPAQLVQVGNTELDIDRLDVVGPLRPKLAMGPVQRNDDAAKVLNPDTTVAAQNQAVESLRNGFTDWYLWGALGVVGVALAAAALVGCFRMLAILRRESRAGREHVTVAEVWQRCAGAIGRMTAVAVVASVVAWGACGALAYRGTMSGLATISSVSDLVGSVHVSPAPVGPPVFGYSGAVIGDSRAARVGGPPVASPTADDTACQRSADSLAAELTMLVPDRVLNLACPSATIAQGLRGTQQRGALQVPAQLGLLKQVQGLQFVVVAIGPNDIGWSDFLKYCYGLPTCDDALTTGEFDYRMAAFDRDYAALLQDLNELPGKPQVIVMTSYGAFPAATDPACPDARGPLSTAGLTQDKIDLLTARNDQLNDVLTGGAEKYGFGVARPDLTGLCSTGGDGLGPDLQGLDDAFPFHPTAVGSLRMAAAVARLVVEPEG